MLSNGTIISNWGPTHIATQELVSLRYEEILLPCVRYVFSSKRNRCVKYLSQEVNALSICMTLYLYISLSKRLLCSKLRGKFGLWVGHYLLCTYCWYLLLSISFLKGTVSDVNCARSKMYSCAWYEKIGDFYKHIRVYLFQEICEINAKPTSFRIHSLVFILTSLMMHWLQILLNFNAKTDWHPLFKTLKKFRCKSKV